MVKKIIMINYSVVCLAGGISREFRIYCGGTFNDGGGGGEATKGRERKCPRAPRRLRQLQVLATQLTIIKSIKGANV